MTESHLLAEVDAAKARILNLEAQIGPLRRALTTAATYDHIASADDFARGHQIAASVRARLTPLVDQQTDLRNYRAACVAKLDQVRRGGTVLLRKGVKRSEKLVNAEALA